MRAIGGGLGAAALRSSRSSVSGCEEALGHEDGACVHCIMVLSSERLEDALGPTMVEQPIDSEELSAARADFEAACTQLTEVSLPVSYTHLTLPTICSV